MIKEIDYKEINQIILENSNFIITTHLNPDGDAIGSSTGLYHFIKFLGKNVKVINHDPTPKNLKFLDNNLIEVYSKEDHSLGFLSADVIIILDLNDSKRLKEIGVELLNSKAIKIVIDHHLEPKEFADYYKIDLEKASTCELVYELIENSGNKLNFEIAQSLYTGIFTDTGGFRFDRTTSRTFEIVSKLCNAGVKPEQLYDNIMNFNSLAGYKLYGRILSKIEIYENGLVGVLTVREQDYAQTGGTKEDLEGIASSPLNIKGVKISLMITENVEKNELKGSLRSKDEFNIRDIAGAFGGGGHANSSGFRIERNMSLSELKVETLKKISEYIKKRDV